MFVRAQTSVVQLSDVAKALECLSHKSLSGWKREQIEPFKGATDILIYNYVFDGRKVLLRIMYHPSALDASKAFSSFRNDFASERNPQKIQNLGDDAFSFGFDDEIVMRKSNLILYVVSGTDIGQLLPEVEKAEVNALVRTESLLLSKSFARTLDKMLSNLSEACSRSRPDLY